MADKNLLKAFDESMETLEKSIKGNVETGAGAVADKGFADEPPEATVAAVPPENEGINEDEELGPDGLPLKPKKVLKKSLYDEMQGSDGDLLEVTPFLDNLTKAISRRLGNIEKSIVGMVQMQKSISEGLHSTGQLVKSIADTPEPRQAVISRQGRTFTDKDGKEAVMTREEILTKAQTAVAQGKMTLQKASVLEERLNTGNPISDGDMQLIKSL